MKKYLLFDLDGTIIESEEGIINAVMYALGKLGINEDNRSSLRHFIGPPLADSFRNTYGLSAEKAETAVAFYREYYSEKGIFECSVYEGIPKMLEFLSKRAGKTLALVSSKPQVFTERILEHFELSQYFTLILGSELNGERVKKAELIAEALKRLGANASEAIMIGDRKYDIAGAAANGVLSIGTMYGYGGQMELMDAGADHIVSTIKTLTDRLLRFA